MTRLILEIVFVVFVIIAGFIRRPFERQNKKNSVNVNKKDTKEKLLLGLVMLGMTILPLVYILSPWLDFANYDLPIWLNVLGTLLLIPTAVLFYRSHKDLGQNWSVSLEIREEHHLVTNGIYNYVRHPMYSAIFLWTICQGLLLQNYIAGLSGFLGFGLLYLFRVGREEKMMEKEFGEQYMEYKKNTKRLIPNII